MAVTLFVQYKVGSCDSWKLVQDEHEARRRRHGAIGHTIRRSADDPSLFMGTSYWPVAANARAFLADPSLKEAMDRAGVAVATTTLCEDEAGPSPAAATAAHEVEPGDRAASWPDLLVAFAARTLETAAFAQAGSASGDRRPAPGAGWSAASTGAGGSWITAMASLEGGDLQASLGVVEEGLASCPTDHRLRWVLGRILMAADKHHEATRVLGQVLEEDPGIAEVRYDLAVASRGLGTHQGWAAARDLFIGLLDARDPDVSIMRQAAEMCAWVGPLGRSIELWRSVADRSGLAGDYFRLSEELAAGDLLSEAVAAMRRAVELDPERYGKLLSDIELAETRTRTKSADDVVRKGRYPDTDMIQGNLRRTILEYVAADLSDAPRFISKDTAFFSMGSCFARNIVRALAGRGYVANNMEISEYINTTFANRHFVDWLDGSLGDGEVSRRIEELLPPGYSKSVLLERVQSCDVFILTLGVAPAFFDKHTGEFVLPKSTALNSRALAEKYEFRTTSVAENVANIEYLLSFVRRLNPRSVIVLTESPVPLKMTFERRSAVIADCLSKSTLRVAINEVMRGQKFKKMHYWPSFEVFRWLGSHLGPVYGNDDGAAWHVSEALVDLVVDCFVETFRDREA